MVSAQRRFFGGTILRVSKQAAIEQLIQAIETVAVGGNYFNSETAKAVLNRLVETEPEGRNQITLREQQVLVALTEGLKTKEIASRFGLSQRTIETHREHIMEKLNIRNVAGLTRFAIAQNLIVLPGGLEA